MKPLQREKAQPGQCAAFLKKYEMKDYLGGGQQGFAVEVTDGKTIHAAKIVSNIRDGMEEWIIMQQLTQLKHYWYSPTYVKGIEAFKCTGQELMEVNIFPEHLQKHQKTEEPAEPAPEYLIVVQEKTVGDLEKYLQAMDVTTGISASQTKSIFFQLVFGIYAAYFKLGFQHKDVKLDNIMLRKFPPNIKEICYKWSGKCACVETQNPEGHEVPVPLWADYGASTMGTCSTTEANRASKKKTKDKYMETVVPCIRKAHGSSATSDLFMVGKLLADTLKIKKSESWPWLDEDVKLAGHLREAFSDVYDFSNSDSLDMPSTGVCLDGNFTKSMEEKKYQYKESDLKAEKYKKLFTQFLNHEFFKDLKKADSCKAENLKNNKKRLVYGWIGQTPGVVGYK